MPFEPLTPKEQFKPPCSHPQHNPPGMIVITKPMKWRCPGCGHTIIIRPSNVRMMACR